MSSQIPWYQHYNSQEIISAGLDKARQLVFCVVVALLDQSQLTGKWTFDRLVKCLQQTSKTLFPTSYRHCCQQ